MLVRDVHVEQFTTKSHMNLRVLKPVSLNLPVFHPGVNNISWLGQQNFVFDQSRLPVGWHKQTSASLGFDLEVTQLQHYQHKHMGKLVRISSNYRQLSNILQLYSQVTSPRVVPVFVFSS